MNHAALLFIASGIWMIVSCMPSNSLSARCPPLYAYIVGSIILGLAIAQYLSHL